MSGLKQNLFSLASISGVAPFSQSASVNNSQNNAEDALAHLKRAKVLYDYDAKDGNELSAHTGEVIFVKDIPNDEDYMWGVRGQDAGRIPRAFLEMFA